MDHLRECAHSSGRKGLESRGQRSASGRPRVDVTGVADAYLDAAWDGRLRERVLARLADEGIEPMDGAG